MAAQGAQVLHPDVPAGAGRPVKASFRIEFEQVCPIMAATGGGALSNFRIPG
ncbi:MAG: hypothetical protein P1V21_00715 [Rhizobiaceae bacterium]|nr:hypothetical protein [Rhizobiaceae bacterium]